MKRRGRNPNENPGVRPVIPIELSEKAPRKRLILAVVLLAVGLCFIGYALVSWLTPSVGFSEIEADISDGEAYADGLTLTYDLGRSELSPTAERKALTSVYSAAAREAYHLFHSERSFAGIHNLRYINEHIGEAVTVDKALYEAFSLLDKHGSRILYMAPMYIDYRNLFSEREDVLAAEFDPYKNEEIRAYLSDLASFVNDENAISLELLGENKVRLTVSEEYLAFAEANGISSFVGLYPFGNAFIVDYIASALAEKGFTKGYIASNDGFCRNLDDRSLSYSQNLFSRAGKEIYLLARFDYTGKKSIVSLCAFPLSSDAENYYVYKNGDIRHAFLDSRDGLCKNSVESLVCYSAEAGCAEVLLSVLPSFVADGSIPSLSDAAGRGIFALYFDGETICHTEKTVSLTQYR